jgi:hypothetical protein
MHLSAAPPIAAVIASSREFPPARLAVEPIEPKPSAWPRTALEIAHVIAREPQFAELKYTCSEFARALDDGKIRFEQAVDGALQLSVSDIESGRALWMINESVVGRDYLQRVMREAPVADPSDGGRRFAVVVEKGRTTFPNQHRNELLPVLYGRWRTLDPGLRYHAMVIINAAAGYPYEAALGMSRDEFFVRAPAGSAPLESAVAMRRSGDGRRLLHELALVSTALPVGLTRGWREVEHPRLDRPATEPVLEQTAQRTVEAAKAVLDAEQAHEANTQPSERVGKTGTAENPAELYRPDWPNRDFGR